MLGLLVGAQFQSSNPLYQVLENLFLGHLGFWESIISAEVFLFLLGAARFETKTLRSMRRLRSIGFLLLMLTLVRSAGAVGAAGAAHRHETAASIVQGTINDALGRALPDVLVRFAALASPRAPTRGDTSSSRQSALAFIS